MSKTRPRIDRIDFQALPDGRTIVTKMVQSEDRLRDIPHTHEVKPAGFDLDAAIRWCDEHGFTVMWWFDLEGRKCARAWKGEPWPVRRNWEIVKLRTRLESEFMQQFQENAGKRWPIERLLSMDLAFAG
jgi:hypothetical protein